MSDDPLGWIDLRSGETDPWWSRFPDRWRAELASFRRRGVEVRVASVDLVSSDGLTSVAATCSANDAGPVSPGLRSAAEDAVMPPPLVATLWVRVAAGHPWTAGSSVADRDLIFSVSFPSSYPWFPPTVRELSGCLDWTSPHVGDDSRLCLVHADRWRTDSTAADLLAAQLPLLLELDDPERRVALDTTHLHESEVPVSDMTWSVRGIELGSAILVDSSWRFASEINEGICHIEFGQDPLARQTVGLGKVTTVWGGATSLRLPNLRLENRQRSSCFARWVRLQERPDVTDPAALFEKYASSPVTVRSGGLDVAPSTSVAQELKSLQRLQGRLEVLGLVLSGPPEQDDPGVLHWLFVVRSRADRRRGWNYRLIRAGYAGECDLLARSPGSAVLRQAHVTMVGVGAVGSMVTTSLAKAGLGLLTLVDRDLLEAGNITRHQASFAYVGQAKSVALAATLADSAPLCRVVAVTLDVGESHHPLDHELSTALAAASDLVVDGAADPAVSRYLGALTLAADTPLLHVSATAGAWGGVVALLTGRDDDACWACLEHHRADGAVPVPAADPAGLTPLRPVGCAEATFAGAGTDLDTVANHASRLAVALLSGGADRSFGSVVYTAALKQDQDEPLIPATWDTTRLERHPQCRAHSSPSPPSTC